MLIIQQDKMNKMQIFLVICDFIKFRTKLWILCNFKIVRKGKNEQKMVKNQTKDDNLLYNKINLFNFF